MIEKGSSLILIAVIAGAGSTVDNFPYFISKLSHKKSLVLYRMGVYLEERDDGSRKKSHETVILMR